MRFVLLALREDFLDKSCDVLHLLFTRGMRHTGIDLVAALVGVPSVVFEEELMGLFGEGQRDDVILVAVTEEEGSGLGEFALGSEECSASGEVPTLEIQRNFALV